MQAASFHKAASLGANTLKTLAIADLYNQVRDRVTTSIASPNSNQNPAIAELVAKLEGRLEVRPPLLPKEWEAWQILGLHKVLGKRAQARLHAAFTDNVGHPEAIAKALESLADESRFATAYCNAVARNATPLLGDAPLDETGSALRIRCARGADARTLDELVDRARDWNLILSTFALIAGESPESPPIRNLDKGSVILDVVTSPATYVVLSGAITAAVKGLEFVTKYKAAKKEWVAIDLATAELDAKIERATVEAKAAATTAVLDRAPPGGPGTEHAALAVDRLVAFLNDGGQVHYLPSGREADDEGVRRFAAMVNGLYALQDGRVGSDPQKRLPSDGSSGP